MAFLAGSIKVRTPFDSCKKPCTSSTLFNSTWKDQSGQRQIKTFLKSCEEELKKVDFEGSSSCSCSASTIQVHADDLDCVPSEFSRRLIFYPNQFLLTFCRWQIMHFECMLVVNFRLLNSSMFPIFDQFDTSGNYFCFQSRQFSLFCLGSFNFQLLTIA